MEQLSHPCDLSSDSRREAEQKCGVLRSKTFRGCHSQVDPEKAYEDCLYDVCSCQRSPADCLCPILAAYSDLCVEQNVLLDWRSSVRECGLHCPAGQEYRQCGDSCGYSCADISLGTNCSSRCVEGCSCPAGETLSETGDCIPVSSCPCRRGELLYPAGSRDLRGETGEVCSCSNARWLCQPATTSQLSQMSSSVSPAVCEERREHRVLELCHSGPPLSCSNMHSANLSSSSAWPDVCSAKCVCAPGYVENNQGVCIPFRHCPCHHAGRSYQEGDLIKQRCNTWWALSTLTISQQ